MNRGLNRDSVTGALGFRKSKNETFERYQKFIVWTIQAEYQQFDNGKPWNLRLVYRLQTPYKNYPYILQNSMETSLRPRVSKTFTIRLI